MTACRECGIVFDRAPGTPQVCEARLPAFTERLVREGTPLPRYALLAATFSPCPSPAP